MLFSEESHPPLLSHPSLPTTTFHFTLLTSKVVKSDFGVHGKTIQCEYCVAAQLSLAILSLLVGEGSSRNPQIAKVKAALKPLSWVLDSLGLWYI
jgi:hypothetical protein